MNDTDNSDVLAEEQRRINERYLNTVLAERRRRQEKRDAKWEVVGLIIVLILGVLFGPGR